MADIVQAAVAMSVGATADHERREEDGRSWVHLDGWGMLLLDLHGKWHCHRGGEAIAQAAADATPLTETRLAIAHVRKASDPAFLGPAFSHPVETSRRGQTCYFFHNGYAPEVGAMIDRPEGWDSERLLEYLLPALGGPEAALRRRLEELAASTTSANFIFVEGEEITVANWFQRDTDSPLYYTYRCAAEADSDRLLIASDPLPMLAGRAPVVTGRNQTIAQFNLKTPAQQVLENLGAFVAGETVL